jgi:hypothetical protein
LNPTRKTPSKRHRRLTLFKCDRFRSSDSCGCSGNPGARDRAEHCFNYGIDTSVNDRWPAGLPPIAIALTRCRKILAMVNIALGNAQLSTCPVGGANGSGDIAVNEIIQAVGYALNGCVQ